jgi:hypothetical protein
MTTVLRRLRYLMLLGTAGLLLGTALLLASCATGSPYAYAPAYSGYDSYAYEPAYVAPAPVYTPPSYYGPVGGYAYSGYNTNYTGPWSERRLQGRD